MMGKILPLKDELISAMKVAETSVEAAEYLGTRFKEILIENKMLDKCRDMLAKVEDFVQFVKFKLISSAQPWSGEITTASDFKTMQANIASDTSKKLEGILGEVNNIKLDLAISDNAALLRGYSADDHAMDPKTVEALDKLFNAWLAEKNMISKNSTLYEVNDKGEIKKDAQGNEIKVNVDKIKALIADRQQGFETYLSKKGITITSQQHPYPDAAVQKQKQQDMKEAIQSTPEVQPTESVQPETPQSGVGSGA